jgi:uncharacterized protein (DUF427 family)
MAKATWNGAVLAEGEDVIIVEGNCYFAPGHIRWEHFKKVPQTTFCGWKGTANYYDVEVNGDTNSGAAWYYADPMPAAEAVRGRIAFWKGVTVEGTSTAKKGPDAPPKC